MKRLMILILFAVSLLGAFSNGPVQAAGYPDRTIEMIVPMGAGAAGDIVARMVAEQLKGILKQNVVVVNKPGGSFTLGTDVAARSKPDGYTITYTNSPAIVYARALEPKVVPYDPAKDLTPLAMHVFFPNAIAVRADSPWKTFKEFVDYAKQNPGKIRVSTAGTGTTASFVLKVSEILAGIQTTEVPSTGGQQVVTMCLGGHVEATIDITGKIIPFVQSKDLRILYQTRKLPEFPDIPTMTDLGYQENPPSGWFALYGPANLPEDVKKVLIPAIKQAIENPELKEKLAKLFYVTEYLPPNELAALAKKEYDQISEIAAKLGLRKE